MPVETLEAAFGGGGRELWELANGIDDREVVPEEEAKSVGAETTFAEDTDDLEELRRTLLALADRVGRRLRREGYLAEGVTLKFRDHDFQTLTRAVMLAQPTDLGDDFFQAAWGLLRALDWRGRRVRLLGVTATRLTGAGGQRGDQLHLFQREAASKERLARTVDAIRERFGSDAIARASLLAARRAPRGRRRDPASGGRQK